MKSEEKLKDTALFYTNQSAQKEKSRLGNGRKTVIEKEMQSWQEITKEAKKQCREKGKCTWIRLKSGWKETQRNAIEQLKSNQCRNTNIHSAEKVAGWAEQAGPQEDCKECARNPHCHYIVSREGFLLGRRSLLQQKGIQGRKDVFGW